jgi:amino acid adenylation domain-containing protein
MPNLLQNLLQRSAGRNPENIAVRYINEEISYRELNLLSDRLSFSLISGGVKPGDRVGIYLDKSIDGIAAIFAVLKTGACYVPFDPFAPPERHLYIINDCSIHYLITSLKKFFQLRRWIKNKSLLKCVYVMDGCRKEYRGCRLAVKMFFKDDILKSKIKSLRRKIKTTDLAYILYTSGSTGKPKGVMITHKQALAFIDWAHEYFDITADRKIAAVAPFHFDLSIFDIFVTIKAAATICIVPQGMCAFPRSLAEFIEKEKINVWYSVPSILIQILLYGNLRKRDSSFLRQIIFAGEVFPVKYLNGLMRLVPHAHYYNLYGPTETNVCTVYPVTSAAALQTALPIGKPCKGSRIFVFDETGKPVKKGVTGELYIWGPTLMKGYWNDPLKTKEVLLNNFLTLHGNQKIYRTGDFVRLNKDGDLEFHGRRDNMIKSRGYRIELGEIEAVLYEHPAIKEVAALGLPDQKISNRIKVVIVLKENRSISKREVMTFCAEKLPQYMIPEIINFSNFIPKTSTGKTDIKKLRQEMYEKF